MDEAFGDLPGKRKMAPRHDISEFLKQWAALEPHRCRHEAGDVWVLTLQSPPGNTPPSLACDVITFHGVGRVEDVIREAVNMREGWTVTLNFDRNEETFSARVEDENATHYTGLVSLNPGVALLSAYLMAIN